MKIQIISHYNLSEYIYVIHYTFKKLRGKVIKYNIINHLKTSYYTLNLADSINMYNKPIF